MGRPIVLTATLAAADDDGIAASQTPTGAGNLTLNGALVVSGVAVLTGTGIVRQVIITSAGNDTARTFTITGTDMDGTTISEALTGASGGIATSAKYYKTVTNIAVDAATAAAVKAGTNGIGASKPFNPDYYDNPFAIGIGCVVSGTINYTVQHTFDEFYNTTANTFAGATWFPNSGITAKAVNTDGNYAFAVSAIRILVNSGTGTVTGTFIQSTHSP